MVMRKCTTPLQLLSVTDNICSCLFARCPHTDVRLATRPRLTFQAEGHGKNFILLNSVHLNFVFIISVLINLVFKLSSKNQVFINSVIMNSVLINSVFINSVLINQ